MSRASEIYNIWDRTGQSVGQSLGSIGENKRLNAESELNTRVAGLRMPALEVQAQEAQRKLDFANAPFRAESLIPVNKDPDTIMNFLADNYIGDMAKTLGAEFDEKNGVFTKNGKVITNKMAGPMMPILASVSRAKQDPGHKLNSMITQLGEKISGGQGTEEDKVKLQKLMEMKEDPNWLPAQYEKQVELNARARGVFKGMGLPTDVLDASDSRIARKLNGIASANEQAYKESQADKKFARDKELVKLKEGYKIRRSNGTKNYEYDIGDQKVSLSPQKQKIVENNQKIKNNEYGYTDPKTGKFVKANLTLKDTIIMGESFNKNINKDIENINSLKDNPEAQREQLIKTQKRVEKFLLGRGASPELRRIANEALEDGLESGKRKRSGGIIDNFKQYLSD